MPFRRTKRSPNKDFSKGHSIKPRFMSNDMKRKRIVEHHCCICGKVNPSDGRRVVGKEGSTALLNSITLNADDSFNGIRSGSVFHPLI